MARQRLGQNFLTDPAWREKIARAINPAKDDFWLEIGAGHGEMTELLVRNAARVVAIELDERLLPRLRERAKDWPHVEVVPGDILELPLDPLLNYGPVRVYGNLPYYITSPILHRLFEYADRIRSIHVVIQWEVAQRLVARPGRRDFGYLSVATQFYARPEIALRIPPGAFRPRPRVNFALVRLRMPGERAHLGVRDENAFLDFVKTCFAQKRKTLFNNLRASLGDEKSRAVLQGAGVRAAARAEQLTVAQFAELYRFAEQVRLADSPRASGAL
jgi:16S rRNA (adenine1518-N6/adenine1519-N6)-dimethyltransferase